MVDKISNNSLPEKTRDNNNQVERMQKRGKSESNSITQTILESRTNEYRQVKETSNYPVARAESRKVLVNSLLEKTERLKETKEDTDLVASLSRDIEEIQATLQLEKSRDYQAAGEYLLKLQNTLLSAETYTPRTPEEEIQELKEIGKKVLKEYPLLIKKTLEEPTLKYLHNIANLANKEIKAFSETITTLHEEGVSLEKKFQIDEKCLAVSELVEANWTAENIIELNKQRDQDEQEHERKYQTLEYLRKERIYHNKKFQIGDKNLTVSELVEANWTAENIIELNNTYRPSGSIRTAGFPYLQK